MTWFRRSATDLHQILFRRLLEHINLHLNFTDLEVDWNAILVYENKQRELQDGKNFSFS